MACIWGGVVYMDVWGSGRGEERRGEKRKGKGGGGGKRTRGKKLAAKRQAESGTT